MRREKLIKFRVSHIEHEAIQLTAERVGMSVSDYCRKSALGKDVKMKLNAEQLAGYRTLQEYHTHFTRLGNLIRLRAGDAALLGSVEEVTALIRMHLKRFES